MKNSTYLIGEIGQNHNGSVDLAKLLIDEVAKPVKDDLFGTELKPMDAVKFTKRDLTQELSRTAMGASYDNPNSFGNTYGEHRSALELSDEEHLELYTYAKSHGLDFVETLCATNCLSLVKLFTPDYLKVASRDLTNLPLLEAMAETKIPMILSTGMGGKIELDDALLIISRYHSDVSILHCLSEYPSQYTNINLNTITYLIDNYPGHVIGYSDHSIGISMPLAAVAMGAKIIEKHITLSRRMKGTDHAGSLGIEGISRMVRDIRNLELAMGSYEISIDDSVVKAKVKLERSLATKSNLSRGHEIKEDDLHMLSPGDGFRWSERDKVIGRFLSKDVSKDEIIFPQDLN